MVVDWDIHRPVRSRLKRGVTFCPFTPGQLLGGGKKDNLLPSYMCEVWRPYSNVPTPRL